MALNNNIVILGAGYAGLLTALKISKKLPEKKIVLIDHHDYQLFSFDLYEVATADEELAPMEELQKAITLPLKNILKGSSVEFVQAEIKSIDLQNKQVKTSGKFFDYDQLIIATGSVTDDFGIKGAKEFALPLKTLQDALRIRNRVEMAFQTHTTDMTKKPLRFVVAGGGYTGCELASELLKLKNFLCWKYNYPWEKVEILVVEAAKELIPGFSKRMSEDAFLRFRDLGVSVLLSSSITEITSQFVKLSSGDELTYDAVMWTVGIKARDLETTPQIKTDRKHRILVNEFLQVERSEIARSLRRSNPDEIVTNKETASASSASQFHYYENVYALGDAACVLDEQGRPVPSSAQDAIDQAGYLSKVLPFLLNNKKVQKYIPKKHGFIVCMGGKWAIMDYKGVYLKGFLAYFIDQLAHIRYLAKIIGWVKATLFVWFEVKLFRRND